MKVVGRNIVRTKVDVVKRLLGLGVATAPADKEDKRKLTAAGQCGLDTYNMRKPLAKVAGVVYLDRLQFD